MKLHYIPPSPPVRSVLMTIRCLELDVELIYVDLLKGEQRSPEFLKLNPAGRVPVLEDGDFVLDESRAIMSYLINSKSPGNRLYPEDPKKRAIIDARLYFDAIELFPIIRDAMTPLFFKGKKEVPAEIRDKLKETLKFIDNLLKGQKFIAGDEPTLADISILSNVILLKFTFGSIGILSNLEAWYKRCEIIPGYEENLKMAEEIVKSMDQMELNLAPLE